jgi:perosamine synthetase
LKEGGQAVLPALEAALDDPAEAVRVASVEALGALMGKAEAERLVPRIAAMLKDTSHDVRAAAARALGQAGSLLDDASAALTPLMAAVADQSEAVAVAALEGLKSMGSKAKDALPVIMEGLKTGSAAVKTAAVDAVGAMGEAAGEVRPMMIRMMGSKDLDPALEALLKQVPPSAPRFGAHLGPWECTVSSIRIPLAKPVFEADDFAAIQTPLQTGWVVQGPRVAAFESAFAEYVGAPRAAACSSATTGLHLALAALGVGPGDEVIVPAFTWVATANAVIYCGATPVLADIDLKTFNFSAEAVQAAVTARTRAVIPVHLFGLPPSCRPCPRAWGWWRTPPAASTPASVAQHVGTFGDFGVFSFHPRKAVTTGEGGMVLAKSAEHDATVRSLRSHGLVAGPVRAPWAMGDAPHVGFNHRMTDFQGALGVTQMAKAKRLHTARAARAARYCEALGDLAWLGLPSEPVDGVHGWQAFVALYQPERPAWRRWTACTPAATPSCFAWPSAASRRGPAPTRCMCLISIGKPSGMAPESCPNAWIADQSELCPAAVSDDDGCGAGPGDRSGSGVGSPHLSPADQARHPSGEHPPSAAGWAAAGAWAASTRVATAAPTAMSSGRPKACSRTRPRWSISTRVGVPRIW